MKSSPDKSGDTPTPPEQSTVLLLLGIAVDTTWRMFVPIVGGAILGVWADNAVTPKPLATCLGIGVGIAIAALLVRQQMKRKP